MKLPEIETDIPLIETILSPWQTALMADYEGYNRVKLIIAACFHDLGIWPESTIDYLPSSLALAKSYLEKRGRVDWEQEIILMIDMHHKLRAYKNPEFPLVEIFRRADLVDVSFGKIRKGIP